MQTANLGGIFEYVPNLREPDDEIFVEGRKVLKVDRSRVKKLNLRAGDLQLFLARYSLHQVSENLGQTDRLLLIPSFTEKSGVIGSI